ncbi:hypothetical protein [Paraburkholderia sp. LEh10]|jgi:hypothetical protein|nr:hypothetical protein [Paraburkholderia sp. LEh10]
MQSSTPLIQAVSPSSREAPSTKTFAYSFRTVAFALLVDRALAA